MTIKLYSIEGNRQWLDGGAMFGNAPRAVWEKWITPDAAGRIPLSCRSLLAEINGKKILLETGIGAFFEPKLAERYGVENPNSHQLVENLLAIGVSPSDIDYIILSHLHFDHAGGLLPTYASIQKGADGFAFPRAKIVIGKEAFDRSTHPHPRDRASFIPGLAQKLMTSERLMIISGNSLPEIPEIEFIFTHGHTPGHMHTLISGPTEKIFFAGDLIPGRSWVHIPITMGYDRHAEKVIDEKSETYDRGIKENWIFFFTHDHEVAAARLQEQKNKVEPLEIFTSFNGEELK